MSPSTRHLVASLAVFALLAIAAVAHAGFGRDAYSPLVVSPVANGTTFDAAAADGSGGMFVSWQPGSGLYVTRLTATGGYATGWNPSGY